MTIPNPLIQYANKTPFNPRQCTPFVMQTPQMLPRALADELPCKVYVEPDGYGTVTSACLERLARINGRDPSLLWPEVLFLEILGGSFGTVHSGLTWPQITGPPPLPCNYTIPASGPYPLEWHVNPLLTQFGTDCPPGEWLSEGYSELSNSDIKFYAAEDYSGALSGQYPCPGPEWALGARVCCFHALNCTPVLIGSATSILPCDLELTLQNRPVGLASATTSFIITPSSYSLGGVINSNSMFHFGLRMGTVASPVFDSNGKLNATFTVQFFYHDFFFGPTHKAGEMFLRLYEE